VLRSARAADTTATNGTDGIRQYRPTFSCTLRMMNDDDMTRVQRLWRELTTAGLGFSDNALVYKSTDTRIDSNT